MKTVKILKGKDCPEDPQTSQLKKTLRNLRGKK
jgi:hypothetical protein